MGKAMIHSFPIQNARIFFTYRKIYQLSNKNVSIQLSSVAQSCSTLRPYGLQHARPPCLSPTPRVYPHLHPLSWWCHPTNSSSVIPLSSHLQSFPASGSFPMSQFFTSGGQSIGISASTSVLPMNTQDWSPLGRDWLDFLAVQGTLKSLLQHRSSRASILWCSAFFMVQLSHPYMTTGKTMTPITPPCSLTISRSENWWLNTNI